MYPLSLQHFKKGNIFVVKVINLFRKTRFLLKKKLKNTPPQKSRPIIIIENQSELCTFIALSTSFIYKKLRPKFPIGNCQIFKEPQDCFNLDLKNRKYSLVFAKKTTTKRIRYTFQVNIYILKELENEGNLKYCGNCNDTLIEKAKTEIDKYFEELYGKK